MKPAIGFGIRAGLAVGTIAFLFWRLGFRSVIEVLERTQAVWLVVIALFVLAGVVLSTLNVLVLLRAFKRNPRFGRVTHRVLESWLLSFVLPSKTGELSLMYLLSREDVPLGESTATVFLDKAITGLVAAGFTILGMGILLSRDELLAAALVILAGGIFGLGLFLNNKGRLLIRKLLPKVLTSPFRGFGQSMNLLISRHAHLIGANVVLTVVKHLVTSGMFLIAFLAVGQNVMFLDIVIISAISFIVSLIPITIGGFGLREGSAIILYSRVGVPGEVTLAAHLLIIVAMYAVILALLGIFELTRRQAWH